MEHPDRPSKDAENEDKEDKVNGTKIDAGKKKSKKNKFVPFQLDNLSPPRPLSLESETALPLPASKGAEDKDSGEQDEQENNGGDREKKKNKFTPFLAEQLDRESGDKDIGQKTEETTDECKSGEDGDQKGENEEEAEDDDIPDYDAEEDEFIPGMKQKAKRKVGVRKKATGGKPKFSWG